ncbi:hypothetical protein BO70DRAFT_163079 [Aspergillus heteromorphus CBS 117.55]|uniref:Uncharacterized protein n=1 Tax=Aspergillus heteromorphus CBS 117.55 TaxID=1448321 RepID=A0A317WTS2_9EURO|nr:uncharacterized protein BO70DRAFT_163079 [Aspergillus heteromorphus CBS 117.55]PWY89211.1 hypothetical protein BO70DRAFT_163079 [Aspergillus heteromorphus CBS 117.55]
MMVVVCLNSQAQRQSRVSCLRCLRCQPTIWSLTSSPSRVRLRLLRFLPLFFSPASLHLHPSASFCISLHPSASHRISPLDLSGNPRDYPSLLLLFNSGCAHPSQPGGSPLLVFPPCDAALPLGIRPPCRTASPLYILLTLLLTLLTPYLYTTTTPPSLLFFFVASTHHLAQHHHRPPCGGGDAPGFNHYQSTTVHGIDTCWSHF